MTTKEKNIAPVDVVFCGLVREIDSFKKTIFDLQKMREDKIVNKIILSTWEGEVQKNPGFDSFLKENNILLMESEEPSDRGDGNVWCQMKSLQIGLTAIDKNHFVLKTRTDVYINPNFLKKLFLEKEKILEINYPLPPKNIFKYKVWIPWFEITKPFFIGDECFFGHKDDLTLLVNYDPSFDKENYLGPDTTHIRRFVYPFLRNYPIFNTYIRDYGNERFMKNFLMKRAYSLYDFLTNFKFLKSISEINRFSILKKRLKEDNFLRCLAAYYIILYSHFYVDSSSFPDQIFFKGKTKVIAPSDGSNLENNFSRKRVLGGNYGGQLYIYEMNFLDGLFQNKMESTPFLEKMKKMIEELNSVSFLN